jgi:hypothetical protein
MEYCNSNLQLFFHIDNISAILKNIRSLLWMARQLKRKNIWIHRQDVDASWSASGSISDMGIELTGSNTIEV